MKNLVFILLSIPSILTAQYDYLKFENSQIFFEKIYQIDSVSLEGIENLLIIAVPKIKDLTGFEEIQEIIIAKIHNAFIDYKKYGGKWGTTETILNYPFFGDVSIDWKDSKYSVTISNMYFDANRFGIMKCTDLITNKHGTTLSADKSVIAAGQYIEKYLADLFLIKQEKLDW
jgi:hypothetical protein